MSIQTLLYLVCDFKLSALCEEEIAFGEASAIDPAQIKAGAEECGWITIDGRDCCSRCQDIAENHNKRKS